MLGNFPEDEAREYLRTCVMFADVPDDDWAHIYQVGIFRMLALLFCA